MPLAVGNDRRNVWWRQRRAGHRQANEGGNAGGWNGRQHFELLLVRRRPVVEKDAASVVRVRVQRKVQQPEALLDGISDELLLPLPVATTVVAAHLADDHWSPGEIRHVPKVPLPHISARVWEFVIAHVVGLTDVVRLKQAWAVDVRRIDQL